MTPVERELVELLRTANALLASIVQRLPELPPGAAPVQVQVPAPAASPVVEEEAPPVIPASKPGAPRPALVTLTKAAKGLGLGPGLLHDMAKAGEIKIVRIGRRAMVPTAELERLAREGTRYSARK